MDRSFVCPACHAAHSEPAEAAFALSALCLACELAERYHDDRIFMAFVVKTAA